MISGDALVTNEFWSITGPAGEGMMFTFGSDPRKRPTAAAVVKKFKDKGVDPEGYTLYTYAAIQIWAAAAKKANTTDAKKVADGDPRRQVGHRAGPDRLRQEGRHHRRRLRVLPVEQGRQVRRNRRQEGLVSSSRSVSPQMPGSRRGGLFVFTLVLSPDAAPGASSFEHQSPSARASSSYIAPGFRCDAKHRVLENGA